MAKSTFPVPINLLLLDLVGALMTALGIIETADPGVFLDPEQLYPGYNWFLVIIGSLLMLPMVLHMVKRAKQQAAAQRAAADGQPASPPSQPKAPKTKTVQRRRP
ncbi:MAG: hypothetical protein H7842_11210 [Gammaproteobacteria bacterium SHHR-1]|uniref:hypothetical protein n=1 Tax=Magnetovirga frankeli TaxID=947516 RepID=UPI0012939465|nr:hypothetical protein D5125_07805 [gamma proteobacterium SS-5]